MTPREQAALADTIEARAFVDLYAAAPAHVARAFGLQAAAEDGITRLLAPALPATMFNRAIGFAPDPADAAAIVQRLAARYREAGVPTWWLHLNPVTAPAGLEPLLAAEGLVPAARRAWAKMLRGVDPLQASTALAVRPASADRIAAVAGCITRAFGMPPLIADWLAALHRRPGWTVYEIADGEQTVGGACLYVEGTTGWLGMGSVLEPHRRQGGQLASMARRIADAAAAGCTHVVTETGEPIAGEANPSLANMGRAGFRRVASRLNFEPREPGR